MWGEAFAQKEAVKFPAPQKGGILFSAHRALLTKVERHTHVNEVGKSSSNLGLWWLLMAAMLVGVVLPARTQALASGCNISLDQVRLAHPLPRFAHKLVSEELSRSVLLRRPARGQVRQQRIIRTSWQPSSTGIFQTIRSP